MVVVVVEDDDLDLDLDHLDSVAEKFDVAVVY